MGNEKKKDNEVLTVGAMKQMLENFYKEKFQKLDELIESVRKATAELHQLADVVDDLAVYTRSNNVVVYGVPIQEDERAGDLAMKLSEIVGIKVRPFEIDIAHRLPTRKKDAIPPFIIRYVSRFTKIEVLEQARIMKPTADLMGGDKNQKLYYNEHLTAKNGAIWREARKKLWKTHLVWLKNGKVSCRRMEQGSPKKFLNWLKDVDNEVAENPAHVPVKPDKPRSKQINLSNRVPHFATNSHQIKQK